MDESTRAKRLFNEWQAAEQRIAAIKAELAGLLTLESGEKIQPDTEEAAARVGSSGKPRTFAVTPGTKGQRVLKLLIDRQPIHLSIIAESIYGSKDPKFTRMAGSVLAYLRRRGLVERTGGQRSGLWKITNKGFRVLEE